MTSSSAGRGRPAWSSAASAPGSICWFRGGTTDSFGPELRPLTDALGFLPYGNGVHYDSDEGRRPLVHRLVADGTLPETHCTDDGVGLVYRGTRLVEAVTETAGKGAYVVVRDGDRRSRSAWNRACCPRRDVEARPRDLPQSRQRDHAHVPLPCARALCRQPRQR